MQSFFVPVLSAPAGNTITFDIESMSVAKPNKLTALRNASEESDILKITAINSRYSANVAIVNQPDAEVLVEGVPKLFSPSGNIPEIYLLQDYKKEIIEINRKTSSIPLGIKTRVAGETLTLAFQGLESFSSEVSLLDTKTGLTQVLTEENNQFQFLNKEGNQGNRFFLLFSPKGTSIMDPINNENIQVYSADHSIKVYSSPTDLIVSVEIYNIQGQQFLNENNLSAVSYKSKQAIERGVYLVKVKTENNIITKKIIIY